MFTLHKNTKNNKLLIRFKGHFDVKQAEQLYDKIKKSAPELEKGFEVLVDLSLLDEMDLDAAEFIEMTMDLLNAGGVSKVIRIIPDESKDIGFKIMSIFHYSRNVAIRTYKSYQEAKKYHQL